MTRLLLIAVLAACVAASGCPGEGDPGVPDAGSTGAVCTPGGAFDLGGRFGVLATLNVRINPDGGIPENQAATAQLLLLVDLEHAGLGAGVTGFLCDIALPEIGISGQSKPLILAPGPALVKSVPAVAAGAALSDTTTCSRFESEPITIVIGALMDPPDEGILPRADSDGDFPVCPPAGASCRLAMGSGCACDQEPDGNAGATLLASNVPGLASLKEVYVDLRTTFSLAGEVWSSDLIKGEVTASLEQAILGCRMNDGRLCSSGETGAVGGLNPEVAQDPGEPSTFVAVRVDPAFTCEELSAGRDAIFPR